MTQGQAWCRARTVRSARCRLRRAAEWQAWTWPGRPGVCGRPATGRLAGMARTRLRPLCRRWTSRCSPVRCPRSVVRPGQGRGEGSGTRVRGWPPWTPGVEVPGASGSGFDNLVKLPLGKFSYGAAQLAPALSATRARAVGPIAWAATVTGTYSLVGFDRAPRSFEAAYTLVRRAGGWRIADDSDGVTPLQMWDLPGLRVIRGTSGIVIGNAPEARMREYSRIGDSAVRRVTGVWGTDWNSHVVIVTPASNKEFASLLLRSADKGLDQVAAITQGVIESGRRAEGDRVIINPKAFTALQPLGRRVVITHEVTHTGGPIVHHESDPHLVDGGNGRLRRVLRSWSSAVGSGQRAAHPRACWQRPQALPAEGPTSTRPRPGSRRHTPGRGWPCVVWSISMARQRSSRSIASSDRSRRRAVVGA